jgi:hypothetical protein
MSANLKLIILALAASLTACGSDNSFQGNTGQVKKTADAVPSTTVPAAPTTTDPDQPPPTTQPPPPGRSYSALNWFWQCETDPVKVPDAPADDAIVLQGIGPHHFTTDQVEGTPITISGHLCKPQSLKRDLVFVVDTSGSMDDNDPKVGTSCGRLTAIRQVLLALAGEGAGVANFAIVTFNSQLDRTSTRLFDNANLLFAELAGAGDISDVVCNATGGTNYDAGLTRAAEILALGRAGASKEVYFISDGQPDSGEDGVARATSMKTVGVTVGTTPVPVTIAAIMLAGTDKVLETQIASKDKTGKALYGYVAQVGGLAKVLSDLTHNEITGAELKYRAIGATSWTTLDLLTHLDAQFNFVLPSFKIEVSKEPRGIELEYEYSDLHDNKFSTGGKLLWTVDDSSDPSPP